MHEHEAENQGLARQAALTVAVVAAFLAIATFLGNESVKEAIQNQTKVSDAHAQLQTFQTQDEVFQSDQVLLAVMSRSSDTGLARFAKAVGQRLNSTAKKVPAEQARIQRIVDDKSKEVKHANKQHLLYEIAEVLLQIAIVLASVAIIARRRFLLVGGAGLSAVGVVILIVGYLA